MKIYLWEAKRPPWTSRRCPSGPSLTLKTPNSRDKQGFSSNENHQKEQRSRIGYSTHQDTESKREDEGAESGASWGRARRGESTDRRSESKKEDQAEEEEGHG
ncbi:hypothetical protein TIFTF001_027053 [Ficus carica]|uniref:Uncharacterized protein n=1 Tax=Ficus carica TaxID=3494 RepID=A0AA88DMC9_FICCA|nr:hypothetical protein TIFTF001_027053 [Ficus carica]